MIASTWHEWREWREMRTKRTIGFLLLAGIGTCLAQPATPPSKDASAGTPVATPSITPSARAKPALDVTALERRLKETDAIGVFTKLTLKNQVDDLLENFKAFYQGRTETKLADLRQPYDLLILKVLALLQDRDPPLAREIRESREEIWSMLSDPAKFAKRQS